MNMDTISKLANRLWDSYVLCFLDGIFGVLNRYDGWDFTTGRR